MDKGRRVSKFEANLGYRASSRTARTTKKLSGRKTKKKFIEKMYLFSYVCMYLFI